jgi:hypothetical protein
LIVQWRVARAIGVAAFYFRKTRKKMVSESELPAEYQGEKDMAEETPESIDQSIFHGMRAALGGRFGAGEPITLIFTSSSLIMARKTSYYIDPGGWGGICVPIGLVLMAAGLSTENGLLAICGAAVAFGGLGLTFSISRLIRRRNEKRLDRLMESRRFSAHEFRKAGMKVDEIPHSEIVRVNVKEAFARLLGREESGPDIRYSPVIQFVTPTKKHGFVPQGREELIRCVDLIKETLKINVSIDRSLGEEMRHSKKGPPAGALLFGSSLVFAALLFLGIPFLTAWILALVFFGVSFFLVRKWRG